MPTLNDWLKKWKLETLSFNTGFMSAEIKFNNADRNAAWEMYVELLTRITTQHLEPEHGDEKSALTSIYSLFNLTREIIKKNGSGCIEFAKIAIVILNQVIRPFTAKWHKISLESGFSNEENRKVFREELNEIQKLLRKYTQMLADVAEVEDLTNLEHINNEV
ncbi:MAG: hypothetical protein H6571_09265 [Lewinellaceae bacterium]|nr:hypothetical protein [Bacteroidota bacterium]MCB9323908.1 hypothetical protein [Lewinellaceae bacterium]